MIRSIRSLLFVVAYHIWRSMRGRPLFGLLADTPVTFFIFLFAYAAMNGGLIATTSNDATDVFMGIGTWLMSVFTLMLFFSSNDKSKVLIACIFAGMAGFDFLESLFRFLVDVPTDSLTVTIIVGVIRMITVVRISLYFDEMPKEVKLPGFNPKNHSLHH